VNGDILGVLLYYFFFLLFVILLFFLGFLVVLIVDVIACHYVANVMVWCCWL